MIGYIPLLLQGAWLSLLLTSTALITGLALTLLLTTILVLRLPLLHRFTQLYLLLLTGTPLLIQIFLIYYGSGALAARWDGALSGLLLSPWCCAMSALAINSAAYSTQMLYQTWLSLPEGYRQACQALGMNRSQTLATLLPLALKRALPSYRNEIILIFKSSSLASTITLMDLMGQAQQLNYQTYDTLTILMLTGSLYLFITLLLSSCLRWLAQQFPS
jgi:arginine transport system permease protein